ncbi:hypothetical protein WJX73_003063 [Symbiochloris irregularis]|uniref:Uncharacterized protein n=1 Tax=Symbiochloris irregularis TaxID=706552 RepID=A0AAW1NUB4_9CHLO
MTQEVTQQQQSLSRKATSLAWKTEQTLTLLLAVSVGTVLGLLIGLFRAVKSLAPHFRSRDGIRRLYYGDPSLAGRFQRGYLKESYTSATLKPHGASPTLSSTAVGQTAVPSLVNGEASGHTEKTNGLLRLDDPVSGTANGGYGSSYEDDLTPKSTTTIASSTAKREESSATHSSLPTGTTTPKSAGGEITPALDTEGDDDSETETEGETGSEYTATSSTPGTPRSTIVAPPTDGKKKKKTGRKIKKVFSKVADVFTPSSSSAKA